MTTEEQRKKAWEDFKRAEYVDADGDVSHAISLFKCDTVNTIENALSAPVQCAPEEVLDAAYKERNQVVAALAKCFPSGLAKTAIAGWDEAWHNCVYIDLPTGQASWHFHDRDAYLFVGLPPYSKSWDGHSTPEKYNRLALLNSAATGGEKNENDRR